MVKKFYAYVQKGIKGYNPPDYYRTLNAKADAEAFKFEFKSNPIKGQECMHSMDNNMGRAVITASNPIQREAMHVILIEVKDIRETYTLTDFYVGVIDKINNLSSTQIEVTYTIDWYTSYALNYWELVGDTYIRNSTPSLKASTVLYRRLSAGEFDYKDEGFIPRSISNKTNGILYSFDNGQTEDSLFKNGNPDSPNSITYLMVYHNNASNTTHWIVYHTNYSGEYYGGKCEPKIMWEAYCRLIGVSNNYTFDGSSVIYYGICPINADLLLHNLQPYTSSNNGPAYVGHENGDYYILNRVFLTISPADHFARTLPIKYSVYGPNQTLKLRCANPGAGVCTDYNVIRIINQDGSILYEVPRGLSIDSYDDGFSFGIYIGGPDNCPYIMIHPLNPKFTEYNQLSISIPFIDVTYYTDAYSIYLAQERQYAIDMRNLQSINELVSGVIGGINQGAMISAFSRTGARTAGQATDKGIIGGGMAMVSAFLNFAYQGIYANKEATSIEDKYNRNKSDTLAMIGKIPIGSSVARVIVYAYDNTTVANIQAYQSRFGYQTQKVESNVDLKAFTGYVQADVIFGIEERTEGSSTEIIGLRTEVEKYIKDMFNYGVWFTHTS